MKATIVASIDVGAASSNFQHSHRFCLVAAAAALRAPLIDDAGKGTRVVFRIMLS